jgi:hypothetical protein
MLLIFYLFPFYSPYTGIVTNNSTYRHVVYKYIKNQLDTYRGIA